MDVRRRLSEGLIVDVVVQLHGAGLGTVRRNGVGGGDPGRPVVGHMPPAVAGPALGRGLHRQAVQGRVHAHGHAEEVADRRLDARVRVALPVEAEDEIAAAAGEGRPDVGDRPGPLRSARTTSSPPSGRRMVSRLPPLRANELTRAALYSLSRTSWAIGPSADGAAAPGRTGPGSAKNAGPS